MINLWKIRLQDFVADLTLKAEACKLLFHVLRLKKRKLLIRF
jgi:hypothetical protein